jgi:hypothetical protein
MGRVSTFLDVGAYLKIAATVAVALLAFGAMASPAWAQDTQLGMQCEPVAGTAGAFVTIKCAVGNGGTTEAEGISFGGVLTTDAKIIGFEAITTQGSCDLVPASPTLYVLGCQLGDLSASEEALVTIKLIASTSGTIDYQMTARADNAPLIKAVGQIVVDPLPPGEDDSGRVLVDHNGKELCLPLAALHRHLKHGDEVVDEEGCADAAGAKNGKQEREGVGASGK